MFSGSGAGEFSLWAFLIGLFVFHVSLGGGATVINSFYDRDEGPVAFLRHPSRVTPQDLVAAYLLQFVGGGLAVVFIGPAYAVVHLFLIGVSWAYSHPSVRIKSRLWPSLVLVTVGHGGGAFVSGFLAGGGDIGSITEGVRAWAGAAALVVPTGLFPLTQVYQIREDRDRGDETIAVRYGWRAAFRVSEFGLWLGTGLAAVTLWKSFGAAPAILLFVGVLGPEVALRRWEARFLQNDEYQNHDAMARFVATTSVSFGLLITYLLVFAP